MLSRYARVAKIFAEYAVPDKFIAIGDKFTTVNILDAFLSVCRGRKTMRNRKNTMNYCLNARIIYALKYGSSQAPWIYGARLQAYDKYKIVRINQRIRRVYPVFYNQERHSRISIVKRHPKPDRFSKTLIIYETMKPLSSDANETRRKYRDLKMPVSKRLTVLRLKHEC